MITHDGSLTIAAPPVHRSGCSLADQCLKANAKSRTFRRLEGQELMDAHREKMNDPKVAERYRLRGQTVERAFADMRGNRERTRFHGRGRNRARGAEAGLMVVANNLIHLDQLQKQSSNSNNLET